MAAVAQTRSCNTATRKLGLDHYYMGKQNKLALTDKDIEIARQILPTLPDKWWLQKYYGMTIRH